MTTEFPDTEGAVRAYLRSHSDVSAIVGTRVFFGVPDSPTFPLIVVARVGGFDETSEAPLDQALVQIDSFGDLHPDTLNHPNKAQATAVNLAVRQALYDLRQPTVVDLTDTSVRLCGALIQSDLYRPDPGDGRPRYIVTTQITAALLVAA